MKFGKKIRSQAVEEWMDYYVDYKVYDVLSAESHSPADSPAYVFSPT